jgi:hypothetical protein
MKPRQQFENLQTLRNSFIFEEGNLDWHHEYLNYFEVSASSFAGC